MLGNTVLTQYAELSYIRKKIKKKSAQEMADVINVSAETYLRVERGDRELTLNEAMRLSNHLNLPISTVFPKIFDLDVAYDATEGGEHAAEHYR